MSAKGTQPGREVGRLVAVEAELGRQDVVEAGVRGEHRHAGRRLPRRRSCRARPRACCSRARRARRAGRVPRGTERRLAHVDAERPPGARARPAPRRCSTRRRPRARTPPARHASAIASNPFAGEVRPSETTRSCSPPGRSTQAKTSVSIPWPIATTLFESSGKERLSTLSTGGREPVREDERPAAVPVREPEQQRDSARQRERCGEDGVARDDVCDDGDRLRAQLLPQGRGEEAAALERRRGAEHVHAAVLRERPLDGAIRENGHLVHPLGERAQLADGRPEDRVVRIDDLGGEDDLRHRKSRSPSSKCGRSGTAWSGCSALPSTVKVRCVGTKPRRA